MVWEKDQIPMLHSVISDFKFLKYQSVILSITANDRENNEILIGKLKKNIFLIKKRTSLFIIK